MRNIGHAELLKVPLPDLTEVEQRRIVAVLEDHLSRLEVAGACLLRAAARLAALRPLAVDAGWPCVPLGDLLLDARYGTSTKCGYTGPGLPVLRIPNVAEGRLDLHDLKRASDGSVSLTSFLLEPGDVLVIRSNGSLRLVGRTAVVEQGVPVSAFASYLIRLRVDQRRLRPHWLRLVNDDRHVRQAVEAAAASSAGQHNLNLGTLRALRIPLPPLALQDRLIREAEEARQEHDRLQRAFTQVQLRQVALRRSLLTAAFSGRL